MRFRVFVFFIIYTAFALLAAASPLFSQNEPQLEEDWYMGKNIRDIVFTGLRNVSVTELEALMNPFKGKVFDESIFWEIQGKLYALEYFDRIEPSTSPVYAPELEVVLMFKVIERPVIGRIIFNGNSGLTRRELNDVILSRVNDIFNQSKVRLDVDAIINKYLEKGFPNVTVDAVESQAGDSDITLVFNITEHERISISKIEFQGNIRFTANALRSQLSLKQRSIINDGAFQEAKLIADREAVLKYYRDRGFIDAQIRDVTRTYEEGARGGTNLILTFYIDEGSEYRFAGVEFEGNFIFSTEQLKGLISSRTGEVVNMTRLEMDLQRVADLYFENGYIYNSILRIPDKNDQLNTLSYTVSIVERNRAYIESITIIGNEKTRDNVILREIPLEPGDVFSRTKIMDALRNLYNLQYFSMIIPDTLQGSAENLMDLVITLEEQPTTDIQFGITFSGSGDPDAFPISGLVQWNDRNLFGTGNQLGIEVNSSIRDSTSISVNYVQNWIFGLPLSVGFDFSANYTKRFAFMDNKLPIFNGDEEYAYPDGFNSYEEFRSNPNLSRDYYLPYEQWYLSFGISSGYRWLTPAGIFSINGGIRLGLIRNSYDNLYRAFDPVLRAGNNEWNPRNSLWLTLALDQRDIFYDPSSGYYVYQRFGINGIIPDRESEYYIRGDTRLQYFHTLFNIPVGENWAFKGVLALSASLSYIWQQPGRTLEIENANKLAIDGMFNARGWSNQYGNKGNMLLDTWVELRIPLVKGILAWDFFFDMAGVDAPENTYFKDFSAENLRFSFGGGIRFTIPQFPIRFSLAKRFSIVDGKTVWAPGLLGGKEGTSDGIDLVLSFAISY